MGARASEQVIHAGRLFRLTMSRPKRALRQNEYPSRTHTVKTIDYGGECGARRVHNKKAGCCIIRGCALQANATRCILYSPLECALWHEAPKPIACRRLSGGCPPPTTLLCGLPEVLRPACQRHPMHSLRALRVHTPTRSAETNRLRPPLQWMPV